MRYRFLTVDVFTERRFGGNPLAVLPDARGLDDAAMQAITREFNFSETAFVFPPDDPAHTRRLRIFTPGGELPFAGHPTVGSAIVLAAIGAVDLAGGETRIVFEEGIGPVPVTIRARDGRPVFAQLTATRVPAQGAAAPPRAALADMLSLAPEDVLEDAWRPEVWDAGVAFLFVPVRDRAALGRARLRYECWEATLAAHGVSRVLVLTTDAGQPGADIRARMFEAWSGTVEDPATGAAAAALPGYLAGRLAPVDGSRRWVVEQGVEMGRPSLLHVEAGFRDGRAVDVRVGGAAVLVSEGMIMADTGGP